MSVLKYKDPITGEVKKVGSPMLEGYTKAEADEKFSPTYGTEDMIPGETPLETGKLYFVYE